MKQKSGPTAPRRARGLALSALVSWGAFVGGCGARDVGEFDLEGLAGFGGTGAGGFGGTGAGGFGGTGAGGFGGTGAGGFGGTGGGVAGSGAFGGVAGSGAFGGSAGFGATGGIAGSGALGGSAGVGGSAGSGGAPGGENCTNGVDDNGNGLVDCEDPACGPGFACAATVPAGWSGPVAFYAGSAAPPDCFASGGYPNTLLDGGVGVSAPPATCTGCGCASAQGVVCPVAQISLHPNTTCSGQGGTLTLPANVCQAFVSLSEIRSVRWATATPAGGSCNPFGGQPGALPPPVWNERGRVCSAPQQGGGCGSGTCVPRPAAPFNPLACVARLGNHSCPQTYPFKETFSAGVNDTRGCTDCSCSAPTGATCSGSLDLGSDATCSADAVNLASVGQCATVGPDSTPPVPPYLESRSARYNQGPATPATCAPSGGQVTGSVTPGPLVTVCCDA